MSESDLLSLYSARILELTTQIPHLGPLAGAQGAGSARSPQCGSTVSVQVTLQDGRISGFGQEVKACALGQASAAIFGAGVIGAAVADVADLRAQVAAMLAQGGDAPAAPFADYALLQVAQAYKNRHASILLCIDATLAACRAAEGSAP
jgi:NifU-like protein involved in Fe-S cluster formation